MKNCLVIGGSSKIGRSLKGEEYIKTYNKNKIPGYIKFNSSTIQLEKLIKKYKIKNVIYLAGITKLDECKKNYKLSQKINIKYPKAIFKTLKKHNIYLIYISSDAVYSGKKGIYKEKDKLNPNCVYGKQKKNVENYIKKNLKYFSIIRISRVNFNEKNFEDLIQDYIIKIKLNKNIVAATDQIFTPTFASELDLLFKFLIKNQIIGIFNFASNKIFSRYQFSKFLKKNLLIKKSIGMRVIKTKIKNFNFIDNRPKNTSMNSNKIKLIFNHHNFDIKKRIIKILKMRLKNELL